MSRIKDTSKNLTAADIAIKQALFLHRIATELAEATIDAEYAKTERKTDEKTNSLKVKTLKPGIKVF